jgi:arylsulfatase A-like enzyme/Tfp pilus assembly protein PilF
MRRTLILIFSVILSPAVRPARADQASVILITVDTVRSDRMGFLGSNRGLTPRLDALARESLIFEQAYSQAPLTPVSHATILSGTYPDFHGVHDFGGRLAESVPFLPELLHKQGYRTAAFVSSIILDPKNGFAPGFERGFDVYDAGFRRSKRGESRIGSMQRRADETVNRALAWLDSNQKRPVFLWVHLWDAHDPYDPPAPFKERFPNATYDACVAYVDSAVGRLIAGLRAKGLYNGSLIAVMSDHGESLGEHGENTHGVFLYDSTIRVPLLVKFPQGKLAPQRVSTRVSLVDVVPTILASMAIPIPASVQGRSLLSLVGSKNVVDRPSFAESEYSQRGFGWSSLAALRSGKFLFVKAPQPELYDETRDPAQLENVYASRKLAAAGLAARLEEIRSHTAAPANEQAHSSLDPQAIEKLNALGYVVSAGPNTKTSTIDPKAHIQVANDLHDADLKIEENNEEAALPLLERVVRTDPQIPHAQYFLGVAYKKLRQYDLAIEHLHKAIELVPDSMMAQYEMAISLYDQGDLPRAAKHLEIVVEQSPDWTDARFSLAAIYARIERIPEALGNLDATLSLDPDHYRANLLRGRILFLTNRSQDGLINLEKAARLEPSSSEAHQFLGEAYAQLGREADASRELAEAQRLKAGTR